LRAQAETGGEASPDRRTRDLERLAADLGAVRPALDALVAIARGALESTSLSTLWPLLRAFLDEWLLQPPDGPRVHLMLDEPLGNLAADGTCGSLAGDDTLRIVEDDILAARVPAGRFRRAGSVCRPTWGPPTASRIGSCGCGRSKRDSVPPTRSPRTTRRWSARRSKPCSTRSRTVRLPWSSKAPRPPPAQTRLPRPFCDALEAGLRAEFHETEWKICYGLDSLVEGFIRRRDVPPADVPPVPFDATAFRAVSDECVALAAPVRRGSLGADWIAKTAAALRRLRGCDDPVQVSREIRRQLVGAPKKEATRKHTFAGDNKAWEVWKTYRDRLRDDLRAPSRTHRHGVKRR